MIKKLLTVFTLTICFHALGGITAPKNGALSPTLLQNSCFNQQMIADSLPCPGGQEVKALDNRYQTAGVFLSYINDEFYLPNQKYLKEMLTTLVKINYRGVVNILVEEKRLKEYSAFTLPYSKKLKINTLIIHNNPIGVFKWLQDGLQFAYKDGAPALIILNTIHETIAADYDSKKDKELAKSLLTNHKSRFASQMAEACDLKTIYKSDQLLKSAMDWSSGGNYTPIAGNLWLTSGNEYDYDDYPGRQETFYSGESVGNFPQDITFYEPAQVAFADTVGGGKNMLDIPTAYFGIGHVDEAITPIPMKKRTADSCDFGLLYADPVMTNEILNNELLSDIEDEWERESFIERSEYIAESAVRLARRIKERLGCIPHIQPAPVATKAELTEYFDGNQLNGLSIADGNKFSFITSKVKSKELDRAFTSSVHKLNPKIKVIPINAGIYNEGEGGVHCATSSIRVCK